MCLSFTINDEVLIMTKNEFIEAIRSPLKKEGFRKVGQYWYKRNNDIIYCINVQGSQWDRNDYSKLVLRSTKKTVLPRHFYTGFLVTAVKAIQGREMYYQVKL